MRDSLESLDTADSVTGLFYMLSLAVYLLYFVV